MIATWGDRYLTEDGEIDRRRLRTAVFAERKVRTVLEEILHPLVRAELLRAKAASGASPLLLAEVPLLFECGWEADFDYIVCVTAPSEVARQRVVERDAVGPAEVERISTTQMNSTLKAARSDWVIENSGSLEQTRIEVARLAAQLGAVPASNKSD